MSKNEEEPLKSYKEKQEVQNKVNRYILHVEPVLFFYIIPITLTRLATQNLNLEKACRVNFNFGNEICSTIIAKQDTKYGKEEKIIQELVSGMETWRIFLLTAIPSILVLFLGAWSDRTGNRKFCMLLPIFGELMTSLSNILSTYYFEELPVQVTMFFEAFFPGITGGWAACYLGAFSYISEVTSVESRTFRVGLAYLCIEIGTPIGSALSGILLDKIGYYGVFCLSASLSLSGITYGWIFIKNLKKEDEITLKQPSKILTWSSVKYFFNPTHVKDTLAVTFRNGPNNRRVKSILILICVFFIYGPYYGEDVIRYLFTRQRFNWNALKYSVFNTYFIGVHTLGGLISISLFSKYLKWDDSVLGCISSFSKVLGGMTIGLASTGLFMYIGVAVEVLNATSYTALRSISSKIVSTEELGKVTAVFNLWEVVTSMIFGPIYSWIYKSTLEIDTGIVFYLSTLLTVIPILIFIWFFLNRTSATVEEVICSGQQAESKV